MTEEMQALARRAVACKHWRWMPGMRAKHSDIEYPQRIVTVTQSGYPYGTFDGTHGNWSWECSADCSPDLTDPATLGCLLALVREAHGIPAWLRDEATFSGKWSVCWKDGPHSTAVVAEGDSAGAALVAALEAAP